MPEYARLCQIMPEYARVCQSMQEYARVYQSMPEYARVCQSMPEYARVCQSMPALRVQRCGEEAMMIQPRAPGILEASIVFLGPHLPPQYPPRRFPTIKPMRKLLAK